MSIAILAWKAPTYRPIKTARQKRRCRSVPSRVASLCLHIALTGTVTAPCKTLGAASTKKVFGSNIPSAIVRGVACCCACSAGCPAMIAWRVAAGPTVRRQGSRCERPAPPACGLDRPSAGPALCRHATMACCARLRANCRGSARSQHFGAIQRGLRLFSRLAKLATVAPWLPLKNQGHGVRRPTRHSTISTTMRARPLILTDEGRSALR